MPTSNRRKRSAKEANLPDREETKEDDSDYEPQDNSSSSDDDVDEHGNIKNLIDYEEGDASSSSSSNSSSSDSSEDDDVKIPLLNVYPIGGLFNTIFDELKMPSNGNKYNIFKKRIQDSCINKETKDKLLKKLENSSLDDKQKEWFDSLLNIPFGTYTPLPIDIKKDDVGKYFTSLMKTLDEAVYGLKNVKEEIINYIAQCLTTTTPSPRILALHGIAGTGKTKIVREGISKTLNRPMQTFSMGGIKDSQHFVGFDYTYMNSKHGAIAQAMIDSKVMNPIIFFDELDKISSGWEGEEIENLLVHMTDPVQNHDFKDKYFDGISIDLSKVIFIFAFNNIDNINPILKDRLHIIRIPPPTENEKLIIAKEYVVDELLKNIGLSKDDFIITDEAFKYAINKFSKNDGVRNLKRCIETILLKVNTIKLLGKAVGDINLSFSLKNYSLPIKIDIDNVNVFLKSHEIDEESTHLHMYM